jgi:hypothetical protein
MWWLYKTRERDTEKEGERERSINGKAEFLIQKSILCMNLKHNKGVKDWYRREASFKNN